MKKFLLTLSICITVGGFSVLFAGDHRAIANQPSEEKNICVYQNGKVTRFKTTALKVEDALNEKGFLFNKKEMLPKPGAFLKEGTKIFLLNPKEKFEFKEFAISEIPVEYRDDPNLEYKTEKTLQPGLPGLDKVLFKVDPQGNRKELGRIHKILPKKAVVLRGTKDCIMTEKGLKHFKKKFVANVSAYTIEDGNGDGVTSIGLVPYEGLVAVDPDYIPYHSMLYIPGYGFGYAGDTGGAIIGNCIDLFMYDRDRAWEWGRRFIEVYLLDD